jgi:hypothetical protein
MAIGCQSVTLYVDILILNYQYIFKNIYTAALM